MMLSRSVQGSIIITDISTFQTVMQEVVMPFLPTDPWKMNRRSKTRELVLSSMMTATLRSLQLQDHLKMGEE